MIRVYYRKNKTSYKVKATITSTRVSFNAVDGANDLGTREFAVEPYQSYVFSRGNFYGKDSKNKNIPSEIGFININKLTMPSRLSYMDADNVGQVIMYVDTGKKDKVITLLRIDKEDFILDTTDEVEYVDYTNGLKQAARFDVWDTYNVETINEKEYLNIVISKINTNGEPMIASDDNEEVFIEATGGVLNCSHVKLENGIGNCRLYKMGFKGLARLKIGWRWYPSLKEFEIEVI